MARSTSRGRVAPSWRDATLGARATLVAGLGFALASAALLVAVVERAAARAWVEAIFLVAAALLVARGAVDLVRGWTGE